MKMKRNTILVIGIIILVSLGAGFYGGVLYQKSKNPITARNGFVRNGQESNVTAGGTRGGGNNNFRPVAGEIIASDEKSITVKLNDGSSKIVFLADNTNITKADNAIAQDLKVGEKVSVFGTQNSDGTVSATDISLNPVMRVQTLPTP